jgi:dTDP-4-amino-4,6-dideoxygalactose transaminase
MRIYLSPPHLCGQEILRVQEALDSNWVAPKGPQIDAFENEFARVIDAPYAVALSSGTAALHLALKLINIRPGDRVACSTLTFAASADVIAYEHAVPIFVDCSEGSWNMDPALLREELCYSAGIGELPKAVIVVDIYGQCADYDPIRAACNEFGIAIIEDAAESLGATYRNCNAGSLGHISAFSFNGNKIVTTGGGGMLIAQSYELAEKARYLSTEARDPAPHYQHSVIGFNYRMSNVLAAIGRAQLQVLPERILARRRNFEFYKRTLGDLPGLTFMPEAPQGRSTRWLTCLTIEPGAFGATREDVRLALEREGIEARPVWKPMHLQPVFAGCRVRGGSVSADIFEKGLCLPSGSSLTDSDLERICAVVRRACPAATQ